MTAPVEVLTIGHSAHSAEAFVALLRRAGITAIADVRSSPWSRQNPQFNREPLQKSLQENGIAYAHLGDALGGRPRETSFYCDGVADYERMAQAPGFLDGLDRVIAGAQKYRIALMCAERDPLTCHRCLLVGRALAERGVHVRHVLDDGALVPQSEIEETLLALSGRAGDDLFAPRAERLALAYRAQARKHAFATPERAGGMPARRTARPD
ncbi:MAG: DUF488 domain-containing protein [Rhodoplanes sp.]|uniref:DUF488 domain-containing protein n=1 Tax=Rhodoplanes sp. TaxID=1968906 RepID=UPI001792DC80|nr:DUF488 domain-containing protein [Rhodoplanes sp.]NVO14992.1 DUF488 domain-containing protein [Rhodoplanes sp.]